MKAKSQFFAKFALVLFSTLITVFLFALVYEIVAHRDYRKWRDSFKKWGLMNAVTIKSPNEKLIGSIDPTANSKE